MPVSGNIDHSLFSFEHAQVGLRKPRYDSLAVNSYESGEGIRPHVDLLRYEDGIAIVSLMSAVNMDFSLKAPSYPLATAKSPDPARQEPGERRFSDQIDWKLDRDIGPEGAHVDACDYNKGDSLVDSSPEDFLVSSPMSDGNRVFDRAEMPVKGADRCPDQLVRLEPGDVLTLHGDARYLWTHGIMAVPADMWLGQTVNRRQRISLTFRTLSRVQNL